MSAQRKPTQSEGQIRTAGWVPSWMSELGIQPNGAVTLSKEQLRSLMRPNQKLKVQVWACGMLQASGYNDETAWFSERGRQIPLTPAHIIRILHAEAKRYFTEAGIKDENGGFAALRETKMSLRAAIVALEEDGVCERRVDGKPISTIPRKERELVSGQTRLCFFARPKPSDPEQVHSEWAQLQARILEPAIGDSPGEGVILSLPPIRIPQILKLFQFQIPGKAQISTQEYHEKVTRSYEAAREIFIKVMEEGVKESLPMGAAESLPEGATGAVPFRNTSEIPIEKGGQQSSSSVVGVPKSVNKQSSSSAVSSGTVEKTAEEEDCRSLFAKFKAQYPANRFDEPKTRPLFEAKPLHEQQRVLASLRMYLTCDRWSDDAGQWIPLSSNWLKTYEATPPPSLKKKTNGRPSYDEGQALIRAALEQEQTEAAARRKP